MNDGLYIEDLHASVGDIEILKGVDLTIPGGEIHALMGPNGSGKSTLASVLMGHPNYRATSGKVCFEGRDLLEMSPDERARAGLFLAFQYPQEIPGVQVQDFLRTASMAVHPDAGSLAEFSVALDDAMEILQVDPSYLTRSLNEGFSGGEKKRAEVLQMMVLGPKLAILDETDSGLDIDALRIVAQGINSLRGAGFSALVITHYQRILDYLEPDMIHVMHRGEIVMSGGMELVKELEISGYEFLNSEKVLAG